MITGNILESGLVSINGSFNETLNAREGRRVTSEIACNTRDDQIGNFACAILFYIVYNLTF